MMTNLEAVLKNRIRKPRARTKQNLCADAGYSGKKSVKIMRDCRYESHIRPRREEKIAVQNEFKARRWIVKVVHSWFQSIKGIACQIMKRQIWHRNHCFNGQPLLPHSENLLLFRDIF